eukprot:146124_1
MFELLDCLLVLPFGSRLFNGSQVLRQTFAVLFCGLAVAICRFTAQRHHVFIEYYAEFTAKGSVIGSEIGDITFMNWTMKRITIISDCWHILRDINTEIAS